MSPPMESVVFYYEKGPESQGMKEQTTEEAPIPRLSPYLLTAAENPGMKNFISLYKSFRCLWDQQDGCFLDQKVREEAWDSLYQYYSKIATNPSPERMKLTIRSMRASWRRINAKMAEASKISGKPTSHVSAVWYYPLLHFLPSTADWLAKRKGNDDNDAGSGRTKRRRRQKRVKQGKANSNYPNALGALSLYPVQHPRIPERQLLTKENPGMKNLIKLYKSFPCLWNLREDHMYKDRDACQKAWDKIYQYYETIVFHPCSSERMKKTFSNMRNAWRREFRNMKVFLANALSDGSVYVSKLWYFPLLDFLTKGRIAKMKRRNCDGIDIDGDAVVEVKILDVEADDSDRCLSSSPRRNNFATIKNEDPSIEMEQPVLQGTLNSPDALSLYPVLHPKIPECDLLIKENSGMKKLIKLYKFFTCLWDRRDPQHLPPNLAARNKAWCEIYQYYEKIVIHPCSFERMKKTFSNMRASWRREYRNLKLRTNASSDGSVHVPKLWYYPLLNFLATGVVDCDGVDFDEDVEESEEIPEVKVVDSDRRLLSVQHSELTKIKNEDPWIEMEQPALQTMQELRTSGLSCPDETWVTQGKVWGLRLSSMRTDQRNIAVKLIGDILYYADCKMLSHGATFKPPSNPLHMDLSARSDNAPMEGQTSPLSDAQLPTVLRESVVGGTSMSSPASLASQSSASAGRNVQNSLTVPSAHLNVDEKKVVIVMSSESEIIERYGYS